ncbi:hypothetical protein HNR23_002298 [Nocardiopsis mwathae]|uniref:Uncharacterized protein n=1 Tax=Nocardiopsis mwathae TaxID=1472723 RepID=A0A7W9YHH0_9ACTN|nr:hypothetical protein [Nocardiopsis mwathae]MBB6172238.1 hypothetical protein [Nocardiopsis mwathae]
MSVTFYPAGHLGDNDPQVNVNNGNAATLLGLLGHDTDYPGGVEPAPVFLGRVLTALALVDTATDDAHGRPPVHDGRVVYGGRSPGLLAMRLRELHDLAEWVHHRGADVAWG